MLLALAVAASVALVTVDVPATLGEKRIDKASSKSGLAVLLPDEVSTSADEAFGNLTLAARNRYDLVLGASPGCNGASACGIASFFAVKGSAPVGGKAVALAKGRHGRYFKSRCGANCSFPRIEWTERGAVYSVSAKEATRRASMVAIANSAIRGGRR